MNGFRNKQEVAVGIGILVLLVVIALALLIKQSTYNLSRYGMVITTKARVADSIALDQTVIPGFSPLFSQERYTPDTLYEKINGRAPLYIESGFVSLVTRRWANDADRSLWFEIFIYDMGASKNAFAVYSQQKRADAVSIDGMDHGYRTDNAVFLVLGARYIEITGSKPDRRLMAGMMELVKRLAAARNPGDDPTQELSSFDKRLMVAGSEKRYIKSAFGYSGFSDVQTAVYRINGRDVTVFISVRARPEEARATAHGYLRFVRDNGGRDLPLEYCSGGMVALYGSFEAVCACDEVVFGVHEADTAELAQKALSLLSAKKCKR